MSSLRIADAAAQTGFAASTLRYYEQIGLVDPPRTSAGYREYDDQTLAKLEFIARAKGLGLPLADVRALATLWDAGSCDGVQAELSALALRHLDETTARIRELDVLAGELRRLTGRPRPTHDGSCGPGCACLPAHGDAPDACTLHPDELGDRIAAWRRLVAGAVGREPIEGGVRLHLGPDPAVAVEAARLAVAERACCSFFEFSLGISTHGVDLDVLAPAEAMEQVRAMLDG